MAFLVLLACVLWFFWFADIQIHRLTRTNKNEINTAARWVEADADRVALPIRIIGYIFYAPYLWPIRAFVIWVIILTINIWLLRTISL